MIGDPAARRRTVIVAAKQEATAVTEQAADSATRQDPSSRHADGAAWGTQLKGRRPDRKYVLVNVNAQEAGPEFYEEVGYVKEVYRDKGLRMAAGKTARDGEFVMFRGHILMSIDKKRADEIKQLGAPGAGRGLAEWDVLEKRILQRQRPDLLRNIPKSEYMAVRNDTTADEFTGTL